MLQKPVYPHPTLAARLQALCVIYGALQPLGCPRDTVEFTGVLGWEPSLPNSSPPGRCAKKAPIHLSGSWVDPQKPWHPGEADREGQAGEVNMRLSQHK